MSGFTEIGVGSSANDGTGDALRTAMQTINTNYGRTQRVLSALSDLASEEAADGKTRTVSELNKTGVFDPRNTSDSVDNIETFASGSVGWQWKRRIDGVIYAGNHGVTADGSTDDTNALNDLIQWCLTNNHKLLLPPGTILYSSLSDIIDGLWMEGQGGLTNNTILKCTNTSGPALRITGRSNTLIGFAIASSSARLAATVTDGHGIHVEGPDVAGTVSLSRNYFSDIFIYNQPLDGIHVAGLWELSKLENVTVADCKRHGFAFDDGTRSGRTNLGMRPFVFKLSHCRALECAGNAFLFGNASQTSVPYGLYAEQIEALGCGWDTGVTEWDEQIYVRTQQSYFINSDIEDQQYAESTTSTTGMAKTARATPSKGFRIATSGVVIHQPYFSSLLQSVLAQASIDSIRIENPAIFDGNYGTPQANAIEIPSTVTALHFKGENQAGATNLIKNQSSKGEIWIDGVRYIPTSASTFNVKAPEIAEEFTISGGVLTSACNNIIVRGQGASADDLASFRYFSGVNGFTGHQVQLLYGGETITIKSGTGNIITTTAGDLSLSATYPVRRLTYDGTNWFAE